MWLCYKSKFVVFFQLYIFIIIIIIVVVVVVVYCSLLFVVVVCCLLLINRIIKLENKHKLICLFRTNKQTTNRC